MKKVILAAVVAVAALATSCSGSSKGGSQVTAGSLSEFDSLSYAVGVNLSSMTVNQLKDIPLDYDVLTKSMLDAAYGKSKLSHEDATATLEDYFMSKRQPRMAEVEAERDRADSIAIANGADAAVVSAARATLPAAEAMFESASERKSVSEALGNDLGNSIKQANIPAKMVWVKAAFEDALSEERKMTDAEANVQIQKFFTVTLPSQNADASAEWLAGIENKSGVQKTESGLLYKVEKAGDNSIMAVDDRDVVRVKYTGKNRLGKVFDSSRFADMADARKEYLKSQSEDGELDPEQEIIEFPLNRVITGWTEGMKLVGKGGRISLWIPSELAYGERGAGSDIGPNDALYFDVELIDVEPYVEPTPEIEE